MFPILVCSAYLFLMWVVCVLLPSLNLCLINGQDHNLPIEARISKTHIGFPSTYLDLSQPCVYFVNLGLFFFFYSFSSAKGIRCWSMVGLLD